MEVKSKPLQIPSSVTTLLYSFFIFFILFIATCFCLLDHHQVMYAIITNIIKVYNGSVVLDLFSVLLPVMPNCPFSSLIT
jgi:hypothetical protein